MVEAMKLFAFLVAGAVFATQPAAAASKPELVPLEQQLAVLASAQPTEAILQIYEHFGLTEADLDIAVHFEQEFSGIAA